jgi:L-aspartate oxidase
MDQVRRSTGGEYMIDSAELVEIRRTRAVVVGSGIAGLSAALGLEHCTVLTRGELGSGSSRHAQGGIAAAIAPDDSPADHARDTLAVAAGLADAAVARAVAESAAGRIEWLREIGARFDLDEHGRLLLGREAGHRARRIAHAGGDATGAEVMRALVAAIEARPSIDVLAGYDLVDLIRSGRRVVGVLARSREGALTAVLAPAVVLATGGIGGLYARTTNPVEVTGVGLAAAARAGAELADLEFVQFHPTALAVDADPAPLLTEALRGEGAILVDARGERFMPAEHPDAELAPRDVLARAIWRRSTAGSTVYLDARNAIGAEFPTRFPSVWRTAQRHGLDPRFEPLPVTPAAHYFMGGVVTDLDGRTSLPGLWAVGEVAATGLHGANRLASNSLLEGMVLGASASRSITASARSIPRSGLEVPACALRLRAPHGNVKAAVRALMWEHVGLVRDERGLTHAIAEIERCEREAGTTERNMLLVARLVATAALERTESRGAHWRADHPYSDPQQQTRRVRRPEPAPRVALDILSRRAA